MIRGNKMYAVKTDPKKDAKVCARNQRISRKDSIVIGRFIKGMKLSSAKSYLNEVLKKKKAIPYTIFKTNLAHKKGMGPGRYPLIVTRKFLELLNSAEKNAEYLGLEKEKLIVSNVHASKGPTHYRPRRTRYRGEQMKSTHLSIIVKEGK